MRKVIQQDQNNGKALELRLESESNSAYYVIIAGMTITIHSGCAKGICEPTSEDEFMYVENETYSCQRFEDYRTAKQTYDTYKGQYID